MAKRQPIPPGPIGIGDRIREVKGPRPVLSRHDERALTARQREILDDLGAVFDEGFSHLTMADLAARMNCSLRTLYGLAPSRGELVLLVVDRNLWRVGRTAMAAISGEMKPLAAIRAYLGAANTAVAGTTEAFALDCAAFEPTRELSLAHSNYLIAVTRALLDLAVAGGHIAEFDTAAVARVVAGLGADFASPAILPTLRSSPMEAANSMVDVILRGLQAQG